MAYSIIWSGLTFKGYLLLVTLFFCVDISDFDFLAETVSFRCIGRPLQKVIFTYDQHRWAL